jgi:geranylgeranyl diphosphate synthase type I
MHLEQNIASMLPEIEAELHAAVARAHGSGLEEFHHMLAYHLGWEGAGAGPEATGKRIRPLLALLTAAAAGGEWRKALPAAAAIELVHNFSLIHDDIEDNSPLRRGRPTVWKIWGIPQAVNAGDAMFTLAHLAMLRLEETASPGAALAAARILQATCLKLTQGQYLDIAYENRTDLTLDSYWEMVGGKTAALIAACTECGALVAGAGEATRHSYRQFGQFLGLAFQAQDDLLGIWGDSAVTGKSAESDLLEGKKSLPVLYGLARSGLFARRWLHGPVSPEEVPTLAAQLASEGALAYTREASSRLTAQALQALADAHPRGDAGQALFELADKLLNRQG